MAGRILPLWPSTWPKELDPYRKQAKTIGVAHGIQETVYEIRFNSRDEFEKAWPHILKLKSPGAPLILERSPATYNRSGTKSEAGVLILCPSGGTVRFPDGRELKADTPWPKSATLPGGELPEYVVAQDGKWVPFDGKERSHIQHRARIDVVLITDGQIVDLNSTPLPENIPIIDRRFPKAEQAWGKAVEGIQVRLTPDKRLWNEGEDPSFKIIAKPKDNVANESGAPNQSVEDVAVKPRQILTPDVSPRE
ncbi:MAG: hypothetical protein NTU53_23885 [Planctomycetota bacterium]|nr:hypothetical protein [Planctomycetota bacterium]